MKIEIVQIGKTKEKSIQNLMDEYIKRLQPFAKVEMTTLKECTPTKTISSEICVKNEGQKILSKIHKDTFLVALDELGQEFTSPKFAQKITNISQNFSHLTFVIGGSFGLSKEVQARSNLTLALSQMTFTHQMIRPFLLEQIYRAYTIIAGKKYHN